MQDIQTIELLPHQWNFLTAREKIVALICGIGAGKSFAGRQYIVSKLVENPETIGFIGANTQGQLRDTVLLPLFAELDERGIKYDYNQLTGYLTISPGTKYEARAKCSGLENFNMLRGQEYGWIYLDEIRDLRKEAFDMLLGRLRCRRAKKLELRCTTTPNGFDWIYDYFAGDHKLPDSTYFHARTDDNIHLDRGYIDTLVAAYDTRFLEQERDGLFTNLKSGRLYHAFTRQKNVREFERFGLPVHIGMDFNVNPMTAVVAELTNTSIYVFDEVYLPDSNTFEMAKELKQRFKSGHTVYPDASGKARKTSSKESDHEILRQTGFRVKTQKANPFVEDRVHTVNKLLEDRQIIIHPRCKMLIRDLEQVTHDKNPSHLTHISDALGYLAWRFKPLTGQFAPRVFLK